MDGATLSTLRQAPLRTEQQDPKALFIVASFFSQYMMLCSTQSFSVTCELCFLVSSQTSISSFEWIVAQATHNCRCFAFESQQSTVISTKPISDSNPASTYISGVIVVTLCQQFQLSFYKKTGELDKNHRRIQSYTHTHTGPSLYPVRDAAVPVCYSTVGGWMFVCLLRYTLCRIPLPVSCKETDPS